MSTYNFEQSIKAQIREIEYLSKLVGKYKEFEHTILSQDFKDSLQNKTTDQLIGIESSFVDLKYSLRYYIDSINIAEEKLHKSYIEVLKSFI